MKMFKVNYNELMKILLIFIIILLMKYRYEGLKSHENLTKNTNQTACFYPYIFENIKKPEKTMKNHCVLFFKSFLVNLTPNWTSETLKLT